MSSRKSSESQVESPRIFDRHVIRRIVLAIRDSHEPENPIAVGASGITSDGESERLT